MHQGTGLPMAVRDGGSRERRAVSLLAALAVAIAAAALWAAPARALLPPAPKTAPATEVSYESARVHGSLTTGDEEAMYFFQYTTDPESGLWILGPQYFTRFLAPNSELPEIDEFLIGENEFGGIPYNISLEANTVYYYRLVAAPSGSPPVFSPEPYPTFKTLPVETPEVVSAEATNLTNKSIDLSGVVKRPANPNAAFNAKCKFEYLTDLAYAPRSEKQRLTIKATAGTFTLSYAAKLGTIPKTTPPIAYNAPKATVQAAIEGLPNLGPGSVTVTGGPGGPSGSFPYTINFTGPFANKNVEGLGVDGSQLIHDEYPEAFTVTVSDGHPEGFEGANQVSCSTDPITEPGTHPVSATLTGLAPNTPYHFQLSAKNAGGRTSKVIGTYTTAAAPTVETLRAGDVHDGSAVLGGRVTPENSPISYQFEWGVDSSYGNVLPAAPVVLEEVDETPHVVTDRLSGLAPKTVYHYRVVATNTKTGQKVLGDDRSFETRPTPEAAEPCPNESSRVGRSASLPDCRVYVFATPGLNYAALYIGAAAVRADGRGVEWQAADAPVEAESSEALLNIGVSIEGPAGDWRTRSYNPPLALQSEAYANVGAAALISEDMTEAVVTSKQPIAGPGSPGGLGVNYYLRRPDGTFVPLTNTAGSPYAFGGGCGCVASRDFTHIFYSSEAKQLPSDPTNNNTYEWSDGQISLAGILPAEHPGEEEKPAANGAVIPAPQTSRGSVISGDGRYFLFKANGYPGLYMRAEDRESVEVSASQRTVEKDPNPVTSVQPVTIADDASKVLFTSTSELTDDAYTGRTEGVANDSGANIYAYDVQSKKLTDLTAAHGPGDAASGANVQRVVGQSDDFSFVYFVARGNLAPGGVSGAENLYVWHDGEVDYVTNRVDGVYVTPDGRHVVFTSTAIQTAYDNANPNNGEPMSEVYEYTYRGPIECASCRPSGDPPTGPAVIINRAASDDGSRVFFESYDTVLPKSSGLAGVYEYEDGEVHLISPPSAKELSHLYGASASGDDVFFQTFGEITPDGQGEIMAIYTARVNAARPPDAPPKCQGENCRLSPTAPPATPSPGTSTFSASVRVLVSEAPVSRSKTTQVRVIVPEAGDLSISGKGLKTVKRSVDKAGSATVAVTLTPGKDKRRLKKGVFNTRAEVIFTSASGETSRDDTPLKFKAPVGGRGGK